MKSSFSLGSTAHELAGQTICDLIHVKDTEGL
jgi:hypothetical protein